MANPRTIPESPGTLRTQLDQLAKGLRRAVMFPRGAALLKRPAGMKSYQDAEGNSFIYNPKLTNPVEIDRASQSGGLAALLGATKGGMGAPDKSRLGPGTLAIVGRDRRGETTQSTATDPAHANQTERQTWKVTPPGGSVSAEAPAEELAHRMSEQHDGAELNRGTSDVPLSDAGRDQAAELAETLVKAGPIDAIYAGPLSRTRETAEAIAQALPRPVPVTVVEGLRPPAEGILEGEPKKQTRPITDRMATVDRDRVAPGQGPLSVYPGESYNQWWLGQVFPAIQPILARYRANPQLRLVIVTHSRDLKAIEAWVANGAPASGDLDNQVLRDDAPETGTVERLYLKDGQWAIDQTIEGDGGMLLCRHGETEWNEGGAEQREEKKPETHEFSSTQVNLPYPLAGRLRRHGLTIPDEDLTEDGRENTPHVTLKYGLHDQDPEKLRSLLENERPVRLTLGKTAVFPAAESKIARGGSGGADVVHVQVHSPDLERLHKKVSAALPHTDTHPTYKPHATLAYVKPGKGKRHAGNRALEGFRTVADRIQFSNKDGDKSVIHLRGGQAPGLRREQLKSHITTLVKAGKHREAYQVATRAASAGHLTDEDLNHAVDRGSMRRPVADAISTGAADRLRQLLSSFDRFPPAEQDAIIQRLLEKPALAQQLLRAA